MEYVIKKFEGDDDYSYAVFEKKEIRHIKSRVVLYGEAHPIAMGLSRAEAKSHVRSLNQTLLKRVMQRR